MIYYITELVHNEKEDSDGISLNLKSEFCYVQTTEMDPAFIDKQN